MDKGPSALPLPGGWFGDSSLTAELIELQGATFGRKFGSKDRRPLDPPPVVQLQIFRTVCDYATGVSERVEVEDLPPQATLGCLCQCELLASGTAEAVPAPVHLGMAGPSVPDMMFTPLVPGAASLHDAHLDGYTSMLPFDATPWSSPVQALPLASPAPGVLPHGLFDFSTPMPMPMPSAGYDIVLPPPNYTHTYAAAGPPPPVAALRRCTDALFGTTVAQVRTVPYCGRNTLMFVFGDLSVREEGVFCLRYRVFDIFARAPGGAGEPGGSPVLAGCVGAPFRVYGTKECPGLQPSTELTHILSQGGAQVHTRKKERKRTREEDWD